MGNEKPWVKIIIKNIGYNSAIIMQLEINLIIQ